MKNVYLVGRAGSGKSSCATYLKNKGYQIARFSYPVYNLAYDYFNMDKTIKDRKLLQVIGTDVGRNEDQNIWVNRLLQDLTIVDKTKKILNITEQPFCIDDCRFCGEHKALKSQGWLGIYLDVSDATRLKRLQLRDNTVQIETLNHVTETALDEFKHELISIDANGTLQEMYDNLEIALNAPFVIKQADDDQYYTDLFKGY